MSKQNEWEKGMRRSNYLPQQQASGVMQNPKGARVSSYLPQQNGAATGIPAAAAAGPQAVSPDWNAQMLNLYNQIQNRDPFEFDLDKDAMYQQYKDQYTRLGQQAMKDTMGQAAGLTGGYGSSYSQAVGQQAYDDYLTKLNAVVPDLYAQARSAYDAEGDNLYRQYQLAANAADIAYQHDRDALADQRYEDELAYSRSRDTLADQRYQQEWDYNRSRDDIADQRWQQQWDYNVNRDAESDKRYYDERDYNRQRDDIADQRWQQQWDYNVNRDKESDNRYYEERDYSRSKTEQANAYDQAMTLLQMGYPLTDDQLAAAGLDRETANYMANWYKQQNTYNANGGGRGVYRSSGYPTYTEESDEEPETTDRRGFPPFTDTANKVVDGAFDAANDIANTAANLLNGTQPIKGSDLTNLAKLYADQGPQAALQALTQQYGNNYDIQAAWQWIVANRGKYKNDGSDGGGGGGGRYRNTISRT